MGSADSKEQVPQSSHSELEGMPLMSHKELTNLDLIGQGGFGKVYRAQHAQKGTVVYKELSVEKLGDKADHDLKKEARTLFLQHVNIVTMLAIIFERGHYGLVMEYVLHGALEDFLFRYEVDWPLKMTFAYNVVCGMKYLHSRDPPVIHSDLKLQNVLISDEFVAKICDFGLAKWKQEAETQSKSGKAPGTVAYMAPERFTDPFVSRTVKYDVYSFGVFLWELLSGQKAFEGIDETIIRTYIVNGKRPLLDDITGPADLVSFATKWIPLCWQQSPGQRPSFDDLEKAFNEVRQVPAANPVRPPVRRQVQLEQTMHPEGLSSRT